MGAEFSTPVRRGPTAESRGAVFCVLFCPYDKVRILHAPQEVEDLVIREAIQLRREFFWLLCS